MTTKTTTSVVNLTTALRHGTARYKDAQVPWRIRGGQPQVGIPIPKADGTPGKRMNWEFIPLTIATKRWFQTGWILEK